LLVLLLLDFDMLSMVYSSYILVLIVVEGIIVGWVTAAVSEQKTASREYHESYLNDVGSTIYYSPFYHNIIMLFIK